MNGAEETVTLPVLGVRHDGGAGDDGGKPEPTRGGEHGVALLAGHELGVEIARAADSKDALEKRGIAREEDQAVAVGARADSAGRVTLRGATGPCLGPALLRSAQR